jgi:hypothetical protein
MKSKALSQKKSYPFKRHLINSIVLLITYFLSRIFFLNNGYGLDLDSWRIARTASNFANHYIYQPSRWPGYPVVEIAHSLVVKLFGFGWFPSNMVTCLIGLISVFAFYHILSFLRLKNKLLLTLTFIFFPSFWINSTSSMDYIWGLAFVLLSYLLCLHKRYIWASILLGLASGCRITLGLTVIPLLYLVSREKKNRFFLLLITIIFFVSALFTFSPVISRYGFTFLRYSKYSPPLSVIFYKLSTELFGWPALALLLFSLMVFRKQIIRIIKINKSNQNRDHLIYWLSSIIIFIIPFIALPVDTDYLVYALPFFLLTINYLFSAKYCITLCLLLCLNSVLSFGRVDEYLYKVKGEMKFNIVDKGIFLDAHQKRKDMLKLAKGYASLKFPAHSYVMVGAPLWAIGFFLPEQNPFINNIIAIEETDTFIVEVLRLENIKEVQKKGYQVYYIDDQAIPYRLKRTFNLNVEQYGLKKIVLKDKGYIISD